MGFRRGIAVFLGAAILCAALPCRTWAAESGLQLADMAFVSPFLSDFSVTDGEGRQMLSGGDFVEAYRLTAGTQSIAAYSADPAGQPADAYRRVNLEDTGRFDALTAGKIRAVVLNTGKNELFSCEAAGYDNTTSGFSTTVPVLGEPLTPLRRYYGDSRIRTERVLRANYLATINDLPKSVEKTADKTMKVIYTLRRGG